MSLKPKLARLLRHLPRLADRVVYQVPGSESLSRIKAKNFGQMDERFYRGSRPRKGDYKVLAAMGIATVIDLRETRDYHEHLRVEETGMRYVNIPMKDNDYPRIEQIEAFLDLTQHPTTGKFLVHCAGGRHRTGVIGAVYRLNVNRWNYDQVYSEMRSYDFYTRWGHGPLKKFVQDYSRGLEDQQFRSRSGTAL